METEKTMQEVSKALGISTDKARYWLSLLDLPQERRGRVVYLPEETAAKLGEVSRLVAEGFTPGEAAKRARVSDVTFPVNVTPTVGTLDLTPITGKMEGMEKAVLLLVEEMRSLRLENRILRGEVFSLRTRIDQQEPEKNQIAHKKGKPLPVAVPDTAAPIRAEVPRKVFQKPQVQRELSTWESMTVLLDDLMGFALGRG